MPPYSLVSQFCSDIEQGIISHKPTAVFHHELLVLSAESESVLTCSQRRNADWLSSAATVDFTHGSTPPGADQANFGVAIDRSGFMKEITFHFADYMTLIRK